MNHRRNTMLTKAAEDESSPILIPLTLILISSSHLNLNSSDFPTTTLYALPTSTHATWTANLILLHLIMDEPGSAFLRNNGIYLKVRMGLRTVRTPSLLVLGSHISHKSVLANTITKFQFRKDGAHVLTSWATISFPNRALIHWLGLLSAEEQKPHLPACEQIRLLFQRSATSALTMIWASATGRIATDRRCNGRPAQGPYQTGWEVPAGMLVRVTTLSKVLFTIHHACALTSERSGLLSADELTEFRVHSTGCSICLHLSYLEIISIQNLCISYFFRNVTSYDLFTTKVNFIIFF